mgnify:FL=1
MRRLMPIVLVSMMSVTLSATHGAYDRHTAVCRIAEKAAAGDPKAMYDLAYMHDIGYDTIPVDSARSTALYRMAAQKGYLRAQNYLGFRYFKGEFVNRNVDSALFWLSKAADGGDMSAANNLGYLYFEGKEVERDYQKAFKWLSAASAAGVPPAQSLLADMLRIGLTSSPDTIKALELYSDAALHGIADADIKISEMMGRKWVTLPPDSALSLGLKYYTRNAPVTAVRLFENVAHTGNPHALALLGDAYSKGRGVSYNHQLSTSYFLKAALAGNPAAQFIIAELADIFPDAIPDSIPPAAYWYEKAAEAGISDAGAAEEALMNISE